MAGDEENVNVNAADDKDDTDDAGINRSISVDNENPQTPDENRDVISELFPTGKSTVISLDKQEGLCEVKVSCILHHQDVQLILLAYIWARPAILTAGKGKRGMFLFLLFLHSDSFSSFFPVPLSSLQSLLSLFSLSLGDNTK